MFTPNNGIYTTTGSVSSTLNGTIFLNNASNFVISGGSILSGSGWKDPIAKELKSLLEAGVPLCTITSEDNEAFTIEFIKVNILFETPSKENGVDYAYSIPEDFDFNQESLLDLAINCDEKSFKHFVDSAKEFEIDPLTQVVYVIDGREFTIKFEELAGLVGS